MLRQIAGAVDIGINRRRVTPGKETGPAGRTNRILAVGVGKRIALTAHFLQIVSIYIWVTEGMYGIPPLLVGTKP